MLGVKLRHGRPYHPQAQGIVERTNGDIKKTFMCALVHAMKEKKLLEVDIDFMRGAFLSCNFLSCNILCIDLSSSSGILRDLIKQRNEQHFHNTICMTPFKAQYG